MKNCKSLIYDLPLFKVFKCQNTTKHKEKQCIYYHSEKDKRRNYLTTFYSSEQCPKQPNCTKHDFCNYSHNRVEEFYHPNKFKTKFCEFYNKDQPNQIRKCSYGAYCSFAHSTQEIKTVLLDHLPLNEYFFLYYFKTVFCPNTQCSDKSTCIYAHNWQDYRRSPLNCFYRSHSCSNWGNKKTILSYDKGCPNGMSCVFCHGWKEEDFHLLNYKTKRCRYKSFECKKNIFCPFYHENEQQRVLDHSIIEHYNDKSKVKQETKKKEIIMEKRKISAHFQQFKKDLSISPEINTAKNINGINFVNKTPLKQYCNDCKTYPNPFFFQSQSLSMNNQNPINRSPQSFTNPSYKKDSYNSLFSTDEIKSNHSQNSQNNFNNTNSNSYNKSLYDLYSSSNSGFVDNIGISSNNNKFLSNELMLNIGDDSFDNKQIDNDCMNNNQEIDSIFNTINLNGNFDDQENEVQEKVDTIKSVNDFYDYLTNSHFSTLFYAISCNKVSLQKLFDLTDDELMSLIEKENNTKMPQLKAVIQKVEEIVKMDYLPKDLTS